MTDDQILIGLMALANQQGTIRMPVSLIARCLQISESELRQAIDRLTKRQPPALEIENELEPETCFRLPGYRSFKQWTKRENRRVYMRKYERRRRNLTQPIRSTIDYLRRLNYTTNVRERDNITSRVLLVLLPSLADKNGCIKATMDDIIQALNVDPEEGRQAIHDLMTNEPRYLEQVAPDEWHLINLDNAKDAFGFQLRL